MNFKTIMHHKRAVLLDFCALVGRQTGTLQRSLRSHPFSSTVKLREVGLQFRSNHLSLNPNILQTHAIASVLVTTISDPITRRSRIERVLIRQKFSWVCRYISLVKNVNDLVIIRFGYFIQQEKAVC